MLGMSWPGDPNTDRRHSAICNSPAPDRALDCFSLSLSTFDTTPAPPSDPQHIMAAIASRSFACALRNSCNRAVPSPICRLNTCSRAPMIRPAAHPRYPTARFYSSESSSGGRTSRSNFSSGPSKPPAQDHGHGLLYIGIGLATLAGGYGAYLYKPDLFGQGTDAAASKGPFVPKFEDYHKVYDAVAKRLQDHDEYDDGSYGPVILRLAWHASGT